MIMSKLVTSLLSALCRFQVEVGEITSGHKYTHESLETLANCFFVWFVGVDRKLKVFWKRMSHVIQATPFYMSLKL